MVHGRIGTLDMLYLAPILVGAWLALRDRWALAGICHGRRDAGEADRHLRPGGDAGPCWRSGSGVRWRRERRIRIAEVRPAVSLGILAVRGLFLAGLWALDARYTTIRVTDRARRPHGRVRREAQGHPSIGRESAKRMTARHGSGRSTSARSRTCASTSRSGRARGSSRRSPSIDFRGALNPLLAGAIPLSLLFATWLAWRRGTGWRAGRWSGPAANYLPYVVLAIVNHRVTYIYYFLPVIPALASPRRSSSCGATCRGSCWAGSLSCLPAGVRGLLPVPNDPLTAGRRRT